MAEATSDSVLKFNLLILWSWHKLQTLNGNIFIHDIRHAGPILIKH